MQDGIRYVCYKLYDTKENPARPLFERVCVRGGQPQSEPELSPELVSKQVVQLGLRDLLPLVLDRPVRGATLVSASLVSG